MSSDIHSKPARVNIVLQHERQAAQQKKELPFRLLILADLLQKSSATPVAKRERISVNAGGLNALMQYLQPQLNFSITQQEKTIPINLCLQSLNDFKPTALIAQIPMLKKMAQTRDQLKELRTMMVNDPSFKQKLQTRLSGEKAKRQCLQQLREVNNDS